MTETHPHPEEPAALARSVSSDVFGKLDNELAAIRIDTETLLELQRQASAHGYNLSEFCRTVLLRVKAWGLHRVETLSSDRLRRAMGNAGEMRGSESGVEA